MFQVYKWPEEAVGAVPPYRLVAAVEDPLEAVEEDQSAAEEGDPLALVDWLAVDQWG